MKVYAKEVIKAPKARVWEIITDIDKTPTILSGVTSVEILERPSEGLKGLKWKETRKMFGKEATEVMWVSDAEDGSWYEVIARSHGVEYYSRLEVKEENGLTLLQVAFEGRPQTFGAKIMSLFSKLFEGATRKALMQDLKDIKAAAESSS